MARRKINPFLDVPDMYIIDQHNKGKKIPRDGLIGEWLSSGNSNDTSGNGNHGTIHLATLTIDRKSAPNSAYNFASTGASIEIINNAIFQLGTGDFSSSFWVKFDTQSVLRWCMSFDNNASSIGHNYALINTNGNKLRFNIRGANGGSIYSNSALNDNVWHHVVCIRNSGTLTMYVDNILQIETLSGVTESVSQVDRNYAFGNYRYQNNLYYMRGDYDDIRIYDRVLLTSEISTIYNE